MVVLAKKKDEVYYDEQGEKVIVKKDSKAKWFLLGCGLPLLLLIGIVVLFTACTGSVVNEVDKDIKKTEKKQDDVAKKKYKLGDTVDAGGVKVKITNIEFVQPDNDTISPENGKILKITSEAKNETDEQVLYSDSDINVSVNGKNYGAYSGMVEDSNSGFTEQINNGNTAGGYQYYDVPEADEYVIELDYMPSFTSYKAKYYIKSSDIKNAQ